MKSTKKAAVVTAILVLAGLTVSGCTSDPNQSELIPQTFKISECGGFKATSQTEAGPAFGSDYCAAEVLRWSYQASTGNLRLSDDRVLLNCCGKRQARLAENSGVYELRQTDGPDDYGRCHCMCVFDLALEAEALPGGPIDLKITRQVTDSQEPAKVVWAGKLDLTKGSGEVVIDSTEAGPWCQPH